MTSMMNSPGRHEHLKTRNMLAALAGGWVARVTLLLACLRCGMVAVADEPTTKPAAPTQSHALLEQMSRESEGLYQEVQAGIVRLQLPAPRWLNEMAAKDNPLDKWGPQLTAQVRAKLEEERHEVQQGEYRYVGARVTPTPTPTPTTRPGGAGAAAAPSSAGADASPWRITQVAGSNTMVLESTGGGTPSAIQIQTGGAVENGRVLVGGAPRLTLQPALSFAPNNVGLMFDDAGHVLVPLYLEKETVGDSGVRASVGQGPVISAKFVASDRQTNISVFQLPAKLGKPVRLGTDRPRDGSIAMLLAPNSASARLMVWTGGQRDVAGVVVSVDGSVSGFARYGQFLACGACRPVVDQLVKYGRVKRAVLGVGVREVQRDDVVRERWAALASQPALRVSDVQPNSPAERAGLQVGDLILGVGDEPVGDPAGFAAAIAGREGKTLLHLLRNGEPVDVTVELKPE
jgi:hypothetical protein